MRYFLSILILLFPFFSFAETGEVNTNTIQNPFSCNTKYTLSGPEQTKVGYSYEYQIITPDDSDFLGSIVYTLKRDGEDVEVVKEKEKYLRYFTTAGKVSLDANIIEGNGCEYILKKDIRVYESALVYAGDEKSWMGSGIVESLEKNNVLFQTYTNETKVLDIEDSQKIWNMIEQSDIFIVGYKDTLGFFSDIVKFQKTRPLDFSKKQIYVVSDFSKAFLSKVIAASLSKIGATKVSLLSENQVYGLIVDISLNGKKGSGNNIGQELSYEKTQVVYTLGGLLEFLAYAGFSYQLLASLLMIAFVILVLNFLKQVVGFNVFGIYYPILFAILISSLGMYVALLFLTIGIISIFFINTFTKRVHLLLHAKRSLLVGVYLILLLFTLGLDNFFELKLINYVIFDNLFILFPLFIAVILAEKIFQEDINIFKKSGFIDMFQYGIITFIAYWLFGQQTLQYFFISYPDTIIIVVLLNILIGRYAGLQVFEYFRFFPLLKKLNEEEE